MKILKFCNEFGILVLFLSFLTTLLNAQNPLQDRKLFEPGNISTGSVEYGSSFSENALEVYFVRSEDPWGTMNSKGTIYYSQKTQGQWSQPEVAFFSGEFDDSDPHLSGDGQSIYFISKGRSPLSNSSADIWLIRKSEEGSWSTPTRLPQPINSAADEWCPKTDASGNLYFASNREEGFGQGDIYMCRLQDGEYQPPENLGSTINSNTGEWNLGISANGEILIFEASGRPENKSPYGDLYISFKKANSWSIPQNISELNTGGSDLYPEMIPSQDLLFYTSSDSLRSKNTEVYSVSLTKLLQTYRQRAVFPE